MPATQSNNPVADRYQRYKPIVDHIANQETFAVEEVKQEFGDEQPAFVTRRIRELVEAGWLVSESSDEDAVKAETYRWNSGRGQFSVNAWLDEKLFGAQIKVSPENERPRERLLSQGAESLRTAELIAILVRSGRPGESAVMAGDKAAKHFQNRLEELPYAGRGELKAISTAIEKTAYCQIMAGIELGRRVAAVSDDKVTTKITSSAEAKEFCRRHFSRLASDAKQEEFHIVTLDTKNQVTDTHQVTVGTLDASLVHPREVFRPAIRDAAASVILVHNHPSGDPTPSPEDIAVTRRLEKSGELLGIDVLDHIILGHGAAISIREN